MRPCQYSSGDQSYYRFPFADNADCRRLFTLCLAANHMSRLVRRYFLNSDTGLTIPVSAKKIGPASFHELMVFLNMCSKTMSLYRTLLKYRLP